MSNLVRRARFCGGLLICLGFAATVSAQAVGTSSMTPPGSVANLEVKSSLGSDAQPAPASPQVNILTVTPGTMGLDVNLQIAGTGFLGVEVLKLNESTGQFVSVIDGAFIPVPGDLRMTATPVGGHLIFPILVPDKNAKYRARLMAKTADVQTENFVYSNPIVFAGFDPSPAKPALTSISLQLGTDRLTISAKTSDKVTLQAGWQMANDAAPIGVQVKQNVQNPSVDLMYSFLPTTSQSFPAIDVALLDEKGAVMEEAKLALTVKVDKATATKVNAVKSQPDNSSKSASTKFSWSELAKTGIAAVLKYFSAGVI